jgi:multiple antibiotic resistance protein
VTLFQLILHSFMVLFAMVNAVGNLPVFADLTAGMDRKTRHRTFATAIATAAGIVVGFALLGNWMLQAVFQVEVSAFKIAGGILVFAVSARGVLFGPRQMGKRKSGYGENLGVFPLGFPFLAGPGTIITTILLMQADGALLTAFIAVLVYAAVLPVLFLSPLIEKVFGRVIVLVGTRILYIFIAAKSVSFVLSGIMAYVSGARP